MTDVEHTGPWVDLDTIRTRERSRVLDGSVASESLGKSTVDGTISELEFATEVREPAKAIEHFDFDTTGPMAAMYTDRWFTTAGGGIPPFIPAGYHSSLSIWTSVSHVHDFDPRAWMTAKSLEIRTAKAAQLTAALGTTYLSGDVLLDWDFGGVPFPLFTYPIGTYANRLIEVRHSYTSHFEERDGDTIAGPGPIADPVSFWAIPVDSPGGADIDSGEIQPDINGVWSCQELEGRAGEDSPLTIGGLAALLISADASSGAESVTREEIDDDWWDANAWTVKNPLDNYPSRALPLAGGYDWAFVADADTAAIGAEEAGATSSTGELWFESDWTPPRYRLRWFAPEDDLRATRQWSRNDGLGLSPGAAIYPQPKSGRVFGGHQ